MKEKVEKVIENKEEEKEEIKVEEKTNKEKKEDKQEKTHKGTSIKVVIAIIILAMIAITSYFIYTIFFSPKFKDITLEIGSDLPNKKQFLIKEKYDSNSEIITDLSKIDMKKIGEHEIELAYNGRNQNVKLILVDTTKPEVTFQDVFKNANYEPNPKDFIKKMTDLSELTVELENVPDTSEYGEYKVKVIVKDSAGNITSSECNLIINWLRENYTLELGNKLKKSDIVESKENENKIPQKEIDKINKSPVGEYTINVKVGNQTYTSVIKVQDTKKPTLKLNDVTFYKGSNRRITKDSFIKEVKDASGEVTTTLKTKLDLNKSGTQKIEIEAVDKNNNKVTKSAKLYVKEDTIGPIFYGLSDKTVAKHSTINYNSGVSAIDDVEGKVSFTVNSSSVNTSKAGTYYATYTAKDSKGNTTTRKRKIIVNHDQEDTNREFMKYYNKNLAGKDVLGIVQTIRNKITYNSNWGGSDPVWYGLMNKTGNCYVHAMLVKKALDTKGIANQLIWTTDKTHYWNLVNVGGVWRHYDATPGGHEIGPATDTQKLESQSMKGRKWDTSKWPKAE